MKQRDLVRHKNEKLSELEEEEREKQVMLLVLKQGSTTTTKLLDIYVKSW